MKKIINGRRYDTDTARALGSDSYAGSVTDFHWWEETLYRKNTGEFFLYGQGGPASRYARPVDMNSWSGGERIMPLTIEEAKAWSEEHLDGDAYEEIFGVVEEDATKKTCTFSLTEAAVKKIAALATEWGCPKSVVIERLLEKS